MPSGIGPRWLKVLSIPSPHTPRASEAPAPQCERKRGPNGPSPAADPAREMGLPRSAARSAEPGGSALPPLQIAPAMRTAASVSDRVH